MLSAYISLGLWDKFILPMLHIQSKHWYTKWKPATRGSGYKLMSQSFYGAEERKMLKSRFVHLDHLSHSCWLLQGKLIPSVGWHRGLIVAILVWRREFWISSVSSALWFEFQFEGSEFTTTWPHSLIEGHSPTLLLKLNH